MIIILVLSLNMNRRDKYIEWKISLGSWVESGGKYVKSSLHLNLRIMDRIQSCGLIRNNLKIVFFGTNYVRNNKLDIQFNEWCHYHCHFQCCQYKHGKAKWLLLTENAHYQLTTVRFLLNFWVRHIQNRLTNDSGNNLI